MKSRIRERRWFRPFILGRDRRWSTFLLDGACREADQGALDGEGFEHLSESAKLEAVQRRVREHYKRTGGKYAWFGEILRSRFANSFDTRIVLDTQAI
jgi:hypothetical protein